MSNDNFLFPRFRQGQRTALLLCASLICAATAGAETPVTADTAPGLGRLNTMTARFAPVPIGADLSALPENERKALAKMVEAARLMDPLFLRQVWSGNTSLLMELLQDQTPLGRARLHYFSIN